MPERGGEQVTGVWICGRTTSRGTVATAVGRVVFSDDAAEVSSPSRMQLLTGPLPLSRYQIVTERAVRADRPAVQGGLKRV